MDSRKIILICSIAGIICFFMPFFSIGESIFQFDISGWDIIKRLFELLSGNSKGARNLGESMLVIIGGKMGFYAIFLIFILSGPIVFPILFSKMLYKLQKPELLSFSYVYPFVYSAVAFITLLFIGLKLKEGLLFFKVMGFGYWITMAAYLIAVKYSRGVNIYENRSTTTITSAKAFKSIKNFFQVNNADTQAQQQITITSGLDSSGAIAERILHHMKNTTIVHRDSKITAAAYLDTLFKVVKSDTGMEPFTKNYTNAEIKSNLSNILLLCNKRKYSEALAEVTKYIKPLLNRKATETEPKAKTDIADGPVNEFRFSFTDDIDKKGTKPHKYSYYCPECGTGLESSDNFCPECGRKKVK